jgi:hypothetical protein
LREVVVQKNSAKKLLPLFSDCYRCFFVRRLHHDELSTLRAGLAFQLQILRACCPDVMARFCNHKLKKFCRKDIFFAKKSDAKQHMCSKLLKKHKIVQFEKSCVIEIGCFSLLRLFPLFRLKHAKFPKQTGRSKGDERERLEDCVERISTFMNE